MFDLSFAQNVFHWFNDLGWTSRLSHALLHSLWMFTAIALVAEAAVRLTGRSRLRYGIYCGSVFACLVGFVALLGWQFASGVSLPEGTSRAEPRTAVVEADAIASPLASDSGELAANIQEQSASAQDLSADLVRSVAVLDSLGVERKAALAFSWQPWLVGAWLFGVAIVSLRPLYGLYFVSKLRRVGRSDPPAWITEAVAEISHRLQLKRSIVVTVSALATVPSVIGHFRPLLLLPASALTGLPPDQLQALIAHELAHVRRSDYLVNAGQTLIETLFFYHPAIWWISRQTRQEREHCCDEIAAEVSESRVVYAEALVAISQMQPSHGGLAMASDGGSLRSRIWRLSTPASTRLRSPWSALACVLLAIGLLLGLMTDFKRSEAAENSQETEAMVKTFIEFEDRDYIIGENISLKFCVTNISDHPIKVSHGGDYRGTPRPLRFKVVAVDELGRSVAEPYPGIIPGRCKGGMGLDPELKPGETEKIHLPLGLYCDFVRGGTYTVRVYHDLGLDGPHWETLSDSKLPESSKPAPIAEANIRVVLPTPELAGQLVGKMAQHLEKHPTATHYWEDGIDFSTLRLPIYSDHLQKLYRAQTDSYDSPTSRAVAREIVSALEEISAPESTDVLIEMLTSARNFDKDPSPSAISVHRLVVQALMARMSSEPQRGWIVAWQDASKLHAQSWRDAHRERLLEAAEPLLRIPYDFPRSAQIRADACRLFHRIGTFEDYPRLKENCNWVWDSGPSGHDAANAYTSAAWSMIGEYAAAAELSEVQKLVGYRTNDPDPLMICKLMTERKDFRGRLWAQDLEDLLNDMSPHVCLAATRAIPSDALTDEFNDQELDHRLKINMFRHDWSKTYKDSPAPAYFPELQIAALQAAGRLRSSLFVDHIKRLIKLTENDEVREAAAKALILCQHTHAVIAAKETNELFAELDPAWGEESLGLRFGLAIADDQREFAIGDKVPLVAFVQNVGKQRHPVNLYAAFHWFGPRLLDSAGKNVALEKFYVNGLNANLSYRVDLRPGEAIRVDHPGIWLGTPMDVEQSFPDLKYPYWVDPESGKYTVNQSLDFLNATFSTGDLSFRVANDSSGEQVAPEKDPSRIDDARLQGLMNLSRLVVAGEIANEPIGMSDEAGVVNYGCDIRVSEVLYGKLKEKTLRINIVHREDDESERLPFVKKGGRCIVFLKRISNATPQWHSVSIDDATLPLTEPLTSRIRSLSATALLYTAIYGGDVTAAKKVLLGVNTGNIANKSHHIKGCPNPELVKLLADRWNIELHPAEWACILGKLKTLKQVCRTMPASELDRLRLIYLSALHDRPALIDWLVQRGADPESNPMHYTNTPLATAAEFGNIAAAKKLIELGADVDQKADYSPLQRACVGKQPEMVALLIERGADMRAVRHDKQTALHLAAKSGCLSCARILVENGADSSAEDDSRHTAQWYAAHFGHKDIVTLLQQSSENDADIREIEVRKAATISRFGGIMPAFHLDTVVWNATDIVIVDGNTPVDGELRVAQTLHGSLKPGDTLSISDLKLFREPETRKVCDWFRGREQNPRDHVTGKRMMLFLVRSGDEWLSAMTHFEHRHPMDFSVVWIEDQDAYAIEQPQNPGPNLIVPQAGGVKRIIADVRSKRNIVSEFKASLKIPDSSRRSVALKPFATGDAWHVRKAAFVALTQCGVRARTTLEETLGEKEPSPFHSDAMKALIEIAVDEADKSGISTRLDAETNYWRSITASLEVGWWNDSDNYTEYAPHKDRYGRLIAILRALQDNTELANVESIERLRDFWRSLPQLNDPSGTNEVTEACDNILTKVKD